MQWVSPHEITLALLPDCNFFYHKGQPGMLALCCLNSMVSTYRATMNFILKDLMCQGFGFYYCKTCIFLTFIPLLSSGVVTGTGQTYVVVQEGDNISFVPAEMVQGDLGPEVNGGQVSLDTGALYLLSRLVFI